jgi:HAMP domain-containing protein
MFKSRLSVKISLRLAVIAVPLMALATWLAVLGARDTVSDMLLDQGRVAALAGAQAYSSILESAVNAGTLTLTDVIEPSYEDIQFPGLVYCKPAPGATPVTAPAAVTAVPSAAPTAHAGAPVPAGTVPPAVAPSMTPVVLAKSDPSYKCIEDRRYLTKYGEYTDSHGIQGIQDAILGSSDSFIYASGIDIRGYVATPHLKYAEPPNGDHERDRAVSRGKRKYDQPLHLAAAGYVGNEPTLVQDYHRDTGEQIWDVAAPIFVKGRHFGAFRVGVVKDRVHAQAVGLAWSLGRMLGAAVLLLVGIVLVSTQRLMRPLVELSCVATQLSTSEDGREFERKIRAESTDEVGQMATSLDRLRQSLRAAWIRVSLLDDALISLNDALIALGIRSPKGGDSADNARRRCAEVEARTLRREVS